jgi:hypothetical protein
MPLLSGVRTQWFIDMYLCILTFYSSPPASTCDVAGGRRMGLVFRHFSDCVSSGTYSRTVRWR